MKQEIAKIWVEALRSGEYTQGRERLKKITKGVVTHCCLGVLCELYNQQNDQPLKQQTTNDVDDDCVCFDSCFINLPPIVQEWAGLGSRCGVYRFGILSDMNDEGVSCLEIADIIEQNIENL